MERIAPVRAGAICFWLRVLRKNFALLAPQLKDIVLEQGAVLQEQGERIDQV